MPGFGPVACNTWLSTGLDDRYHELRVSIVRANALITHRQPCPLENGVFTSHHGPWVLTVQVMSLEGIEQRQGQRLRRFCSLETLPVAAEAMPSDAVSRVLFASLGPNGPCRCACWMGFPAVHRWVHLRLQVLAPRKTNAHTPEKSHALHNLLAFFLCLVPFLASRTVHLHLESALGPGLLLELFLGGGATVGLGSEGWMSRQAWKRGLSSLSVLLLYFQSLAAQICFLLTCPLPVCVASRPIIISFETTSLSLPTFVFWEWGVSFCR